MITKALFESHVRDALANLNRPAHLQTHALVSLLCSEVAQETRTQALREVLTDTMEALRPPQSIPYNRPEWLNYRVMRLRYLECISPDDACSELGLSRTSFYRYYNEALNGYISLLWDAYERQRHSHAEESDMQAPRDLAKEEAIKLACASERQPISFADVLTSAEGTIGPLLRQKGIRLSITFDGALPTIYADPTLMRQMVLSLLIKMANTAVRQDLTIGVGVEKDEISVQIKGLKQDQLAKIEQDAHDLGLFRGMLEIYGGRFWVEQKPTPTLCFSIPVDRPKTILIIEDDGDTIALYRRYLQGQNYQIKAVNTGEDCWATIKKAQPDIILLDVLMPQEDGWEILRSLKQSERATSVPVVICSVLRQPQLALALGAAQVLQKPIHQDTLLKTVQRHLRNTDSRH
jgi:CheY-like chemotaxis protein